MNRCSKQYHSNGVSIGRLHEGQTVVLPVEVPIEDGAAVLADAAASDNIGAIAVVDTVCGSGSVADEGSYDDARSVASFVPCSASNSPNLDEPSCTIPLLPRHLHRGSADFLELECLGPRTP